MAVPSLTPARPHSPQGLQHGRLPGPLPSGFSARAAKVSVSANPAAVKNRVSRFMFFFPLGSRLLGGGQVGAARVLRYTGETP